MPNANVIDMIDDDDTLTVSWPRAENLNFLEGYRVFFTTISQGTLSSRRRRQATSTVNVNPDKTSAEIDFQAFSRYMVDVSAVYNPPPDRNEVLVVLLPTTTFTTPQRRKIRVATKQGSKFGGSRVKRFGGIVNSWSVWGAL